ncbi:Erg28 like protein [Hibiscus syriacus]|uniref:Erg28 like protein n=1 Tax=Hibiscus syriacus TaxID=106335 RepID=A0A6A2XM04_HIBSY|nr:Erg28 like protein [Hibiscus syriacus]
MDACFSLGKSQIDRIVRGSSCKVSIEVYYGPNGSTCGLAYNKLLGKTLIEATRNGSSPQLCLTVRTKPDPRFVFLFGGEPECSPHVFQVQDSLKQPVFICKNWLIPLKSDKEQSSKERKGWSIIIHNLSGSPVAMTSMVTPFVPSPGSDRVTRSNPGAWLILRPGCGTWKLWGRPEAWRESSFNDALRYRFDLFHDDINTTNATNTVATSTISTKHRGKFIMDKITNVATPSITPQSSGDFGLRTSMSLSNSRVGSGSRSDFSRMEVEVGVHHMTCTEDATSFVALAAAMNLSVDSCLSFSRKLRK